MRGKKSKIFKHHFSFAFKLAASFALGIVAVVFIFSASTTYLMGREVLQRQTNELLFYADKIASDWRFSNEDALRFESQLNIPYYLSYTIFRKNLDDIKIESSNDRFLPVFSDTKNKAIKYIDDDYYIDGRLYVLYVVIPIEKGKRQATQGQADSPSLFVQVSIDMDRDTTQSMIDTMPRIFFFMALPLLFISFLLSLYFVRRSLKPVREMVVTAKKIGSENLDARLAIDNSNDEFDTLAKTFNELFSRLEIDFKRERQFTSDVSHELKTPLAVIAGHANLLRRWGKDDPAQLIKSVNTITSESKNMQSIVENLLELSHVENGQFSVKFANVSVKALFERLASELEVYAPSAKLTINIPVSKNNLEELFVYADENMLHEVLTILISNSVRYSPEPALITLAAQKVDLESNKIKITVTDCGYGISKEALPHVFERFYREDKAHTRNRSSGSGLGLAIAKALIMAMGAKIFVDSNAKKDSISVPEQSGTCVTILI